MKTDPRDAYRLKLLDPRWQKIRLKVFERDTWRCIQCGRSDRTLHVHHKQYTASEPWDEPVENLVTVCVACHADEHGLSIESDEITSMIEAMPNSVRPAKDLVRGVIEKIEKLHETRGAITGIATGFSDLDAMTDGLHPGEMIVVAARPSMGKTAFAMGIAEHVAINLGKPVAVFSLEMTADQLTQRTLCSLARVNLGSIRNGYLSGRDFSAIAGSAKTLARSDLIIDAASALTIHELGRRLRYYVKERGVTLAVVDYLQLLRSPTYRASTNRQVEIAEISAGIKALAKELDIPIIAVAQLNRNAEGRSGESKGRPRLSDLRDSGSIEQDADLVLLLLREEYYAENDQERDSLSGKATAIIAKQRNGPVGDIALTFIKQFVRFESAAQACDSK